MKIVAIIPARAGSKRLPNKHILPFGDSNLLLHKIRQLKAVPLIDEIVLSTDCAVMTQMASQEGVRIHKRPKEYCDETSKTFNEVVAYIADSIDADILVWSPCVCPIVSTQSYTRAIEIFLSQRSYDCVISALPLKEYVFDDTNTPINFSIDRHVPTQRLPNWHIIANGFFIAKRTDMVRWRFVYGKNPYLFELSKFEGIDIDDGDDFALAQYIHMSLQRGEYNENKFA